MPDSFLIARSGTPKAGTATDTHTPPPPRGLHPQASPGTGCSASCREDFCPNSAPPAPPDGLCRTTEHVTGTACPRAAGEPPAWGLGGATLCPRGHHDPPPGPAPNPTRASPSKNSNPASYLLAEGARKQGDLTARQVPACPGKPWQVAGRGHVSTPRLATLRPSRLVSGADLPILGPPPWPRCHPRVPRLEITASP